eukprot:327618_1
MGSNLSYTYHLDRIYSHILREVGCDCISSAHIPVLIYNSLVIPLIIKWIGKLDVNKLSAFFQFVYIASITCICVAYTLYLLQKPIKHGVNTVIHKIGDYVVDCIEPLQIVKIVKATTLN